MGGAPTTHLMKFARPDEPGLVANELLCLRVFRALGFDTARARAVEIAGRHALLVRRYDRVWVRDPATGRRAVSRVHQEDAAQALGLPRALKYERDALAAGVQGGFAALLGPFAGFSERPALARRALMRASFLNWLLGNSDAHLNNFALLHAPPAPGGRAAARRPRLAPFYDVVSMAALPGGRYNLDPAMRIGKAEAWDRVERPDWEALVRLAVGGGGAGRARSAPAGAVRRSVDALRDLAAGALPAIDAAVDRGDINRLDAKPVRDVVGTRLRQLNRTMTGWLAIPAETDHAFGGRSGGWASP